MPARKPKKLKVLYDPWNIGRPVTICHAGKTYRRQWLDDARRFAREHGYDGIHVRC